MNREDLLLQINKLKVKMGTLWDERGRTDPDILELSVELDELLNQYYRSLTT